MSAKGKKTSASSHGRSFGSSEISAPSTTARRPVNWPFSSIGFVVPSYQSDRMPLATVTELPGIFQTSCQGDAALRASFRESTEQAGRELRAYEVTSNGVVVGKRLSEFTGVITAVPHRRDPREK